MIKTKTNTNTVLLVGILVVLGFILGFLVISNTEESTSGFDACMDQAELRFEELLCEARRDQGLLD